MNLSQRFHEGSSVLTDALLWYGNERTWWMVAVHVPRIGVAKLRWRKARNPAVRAKGGSWRSRPVFTWIPVS